MHIFYSTARKGQWVELPEEESLHLAKVLRMKAGETVGWMDGQGGLYAARIVQVHARNSVLEIEKVLEQQVRRVPLHIALAPTKMMERYEWFLEKAVELGVERITPILTQRTERNVVKAARMEKIVLSAMKQSKQAWMPQLDEPMRFTDLFHDASLPEQKYLAHCLEVPKPVLWNAWNLDASMLVCIGPEGDFSPTEVDEALQHGFTAVSLGHQRLRTETAGIMVCAARATQQAGV